MHLKSINNHTQTGGNLVEIEGTTSQIALNVTEGIVQIGEKLDISGGIDNNSSGIENTGSLSGVSTLNIDPESELGNALKIYNNHTQTGGNLVEIEGTTSQIALNVTEGIVQIGEKLDISGGIDNNSSE